MFAREAFEDHRGRVDGQDSGGRPVRARAVFERRNVRDNHDDDFLDDGHVDGHVDDDEFDELVHDVEHGATNDPEQHFVHDLDDSPTEGMPARVSTPGQGVRGRMRRHGTDAPPLQESLPGATEELRRIDGVSAPTRVPEALGAAARLANLRVRPGPRLVLR